MVDIIKLLYKIIKEDLGKEFIKTINKIKLDACLINAMTANIDRHKKHFSEYNFMSETDKIKYILEETEYFNDFVKEILNNCIFSNEERFILIKILLENFDNIDYLCFQDIIVFLIKNNSFEMRYLSYYFKNDEESEINSYTFNLEYIFSYNRINVDLKLFLFYKVFTVNLKFSSKEKSDFYKVIIAEFKNTLEIDEKEKITFLKVLTTKKQNEIDNYLLSKFKKSKNDSYSDLKYKFLRENFLSGARLKYLKELLIKLEK